VSSNLALNINNYLRFLLWSTYLKNRKTETKSNLEYSKTATFKGFTEKSEKNQLFNGKTFPKKKLVETIFDISIFGKPRLFNTRTCSNLFDSRLACVSYLRKMLGHFILLTFLGHFLTLCMSELELSHFFKLERPTFSNGT